jgi:hypothetical protein
MIISEIDNGHVYNLALGCCEYLLLQCIRPIVIWRNVVAPLKFLMRRRYYRWYDKVESDSTLRKKTL